MATVFLSYRRSDTSGEAGRLADTFCRKVGPQHTFRDATHISPGVDFVARLEKELGAARTVLVLIGSNWLAELEQRLARTDIDYLRVEVATALRLGKRVIPVLLRGATLPSPHALPEDLRALAQRQALAIHDESWSQDVDRLLDAIGRPYRWTLVPLRAVVALLAILLGVKLLVPLLPEERANDIEFVRILVVLLLILYALVEVGLAYHHHRKLKRDGSSRWPCPSP